MVDTTYCAMHSRLHKTHDIHNNELPCYVSLVHHSLPDLCSVHDVSRGMTPTSHDIVHNVMCCIISYIQYNIAYYTPQY